MNRSTSVMLVVLMLLTASGCGEWMETKGDVTEKSYPAKADNPQIREFNKQLGEISDQAGAETAVNSFVNYVDSRLVKSGTSVQSFGSIIGQDLIRKMAQKEAAARNMGGMTVAEEGSQSGPLNIGSVTDTINDLGSGEGVRVTDDMVSTAKSVVEASIPNINPEGNDGITPLEASVIGYAIVSGDDGTASQESVNLPADKMNEFVETVTN